MSDEATTNADGGVHDKSFAQLTDSGRSWKAVREIIEFKEPGPLFDQPMDITVQMLRGLRMVDETIIVHGDVPQHESSEGGAR